ncbi:MAG: hypothetical protein AB7F94_09250 [Nitrospira sp.]
MTMPFVRPRHFSARRAAPGGELNEPTKTRLRSAQVDSARVVVDRSTCLDSDHSIMLFTVNNCLARAEEGIFGSPI